MIITTIRHHRHGEYFSEVVSVLGPPNKAVFSIYAAFPNGRTSLVHQESFSSEAAAVEAFELHKPVIGD
jgi:hypothetical protein